MSTDEISYEGIDEAELIHGLYHGTRALGMGALHDIGGLTVEQVRSDIETLKPQKPWSMPAALPGGSGSREPGGHLYFDYYRGRPLKCGIDTERKVITDPRLYDRDAGQGAARRVVDALRARKAA